ncbi:acriflavin resistance protein [Pseudoalteromonas sp. NBT06-2]|uniref:NfeD family protein n=1 Tax=Pseudoalteromonas sp. NBT06-2 TaxID=2025950 RepID=UPI000BA645CE|nr:NfeD family protein [Pseudoalteromonas sp. NBT06-2]PAJ75297.1 acriflavin resistance protein [Pseudoalteromonas sp. NBT06-2]
MDIVNYFSIHHAQLLYLIAGVSFILELSVLGMSGPLLFFAIACVKTGVLVHIGWISGWESELFTVAVLTALLSVLLWKPFKNYQNSGGGLDTSSDMIGKQVPSVDEITLADGHIRYSGINWNAKLDGDTNDEVIEANTQCIITAVEGNTMLVKRI